mmetsp:Transcript_23058/g.35094  ORF Transcript_23058/g.35094 Transcript_23058/m.35094 type:complete len:235 (+) Transcript_23058:258-962(+)
MGPIRPSPLATLNLTLGTGSQCISSNIGNTSHCAVYTSIAVAMSDRALTAFILLRYDECSITCLTLGSRLLTDHSDPRRAVSSLRSFAAASRMLDMSSPSHPTHSDRSLSVKNSFPSCLASRGIRSMTASRILHLPSSARSSTAGSSDCVNSSAPMTSFNMDSEDMMFRRTSDVESRNSSSIGGSRCAMVMSLPNMGARSVATMASAALTFSLSSSVSDTTRLTRRCATGTRAS